MGSHHKVSYRMKAAHPNEFLPKAIIFSTFNSQDDQDWDDCLPLKAASVYSAIFGEVANGKTMDKAKNLLESLATTCHSSISAKELEPTNDSGTTHPPGNIIPVPVVTEEDTAKYQKENFPSSVVPVVREEDTEKYEKEMQATMDAVYLVVAFLRDLREGVREGDKEKLDNYMHKKHGRHVICDVALLENQLPLNLLFGVVEHLQEAINEYKNQLQQNDPLSSSMAAFDLKFNKHSFHEVVSLFCWYYSPFCSDKFKPWGILPKDLLKFDHLLQCLHSTLMKRNIGGRKKHHTRHVWTTYTAKELLTSGVRFKADVEGAIQVQFSDWVLALPALVYDWKVGTVVMNLVALESQCGKKPVVRYFQLMNELIDDVEDLRVMKRFGIVTGKWKRDEEIVDFVKGVDGFGSYPSVYPAMEIGIESMKEFHEQRMNKFFVRNRTAVVWVSSVAAVALTAVFATKRRKM